MTFYAQELSRIKEVVYNNQGQIDTVIAIRNYIDCNYDAHLNLKLLAKKQQVSKYHLLRLFKKYYGLTPKQYLIDKRIEKSKRHLENGVSVTETCFAIGFESLGSFSVLFKTKTANRHINFEKSNFREGS